MKLYIVSCNSYFRQFSVAVVAENDDEAFKEANKVAHELFNCKPFNFSIREVSEIGKYKVILEEIE